MFTKDGQVNSSYLQFHFSDIPPYDWNPSSVRITQIAKQSSHCYTDICKQNRKSRSQSDRCSQGKDIFRQETNTNPEGHKEELKN